MNKFIDFLRDWRAEKEREHLIPTVDLLIEELEELKETKNFTEPSKKFKKDMEDYYNEPANFPNQ